MGRFTDKLQEFAEIYLQQPQRFDPQSIDDPVAKQTSWEPAMSGGTNYCTHRLKEISPMNMSFKPVPLALLIPVIFIGFGLVFPVLLFFRILPSLSGGEDILFPLMTGGFGLIFTSVGVAFLLRLVKPRVFNREAGYYWRSWKEPNPGLAKIKGEYCTLSEIHAVQIIQERCTSSSKNSTSVYYSFEINLVLHDGSRLNVVDHGKVDAIRTDGVILAQFLGVPLWDSSTL